MQTLTPRMLREMADRLNQLADLWDGGPSLKVKHDPSVTCDICGEKRYTMSLAGQRCGSWGRTEPKGMLARCTGTYRRDECPCYERATADLDRKAEAKRTAGLSCKCDQCGRRAPAVLVGADCESPGCMGSYELPNLSVNLTPEQLTEAALHQAVEKAFTEAHSLGSVDLYANDGEAS